MKLDKLYASKIQWWTGIKDRQCLSKREEGREGGRAHGSPASPISSKVDSVRSYGLRVTLSDSALCPAAPLGWPCPHSPL